MELTLALGVGLAAGLGAVLRHVVATVVGPGPRATLLVNVAGSLLAGAVLGSDLPDGVTALLVAGLAGGLTTLSTWATEVLALRPRAAVGYAAGTLGLCVAAAALGRAATG